MGGIWKWYKTMLITIKGYTQVHGFDYNKTFNLIIKHDSIMNIVALTTTHDMHMIQYDVWKHG